MLAIGTPYNHVCYIHLYLSYMSHIYIECPYFEILNHIWSYYIILLINVCDWRIDGHMTYNNTQDQNVQSISFSICHDRSILLQVDI